MDACGQSSSSSQTFTISFRIFVFCYSIHIHYLFLDIFWVKFLFLVLPMLITPSELRHQEEMFYYMQILHGTELITETSGPIALHSVHKKRR